MRLNTERLVIRDLEDGDAERLYQIVWQKDVVRFMGDWSEHQTTVADTKRFIQWRREQIDTADIYENRRYAIALKDSDRLIGIVGTGLVEGPHEVELAYFLAEAYQGKGYATEAVTALAEWYFRQAPVPYVILTIDCANRPSCNVAKRAGFELYEKRTPIGHQQPDMESDSYFYYRKYR